MSGADMPDAMTPPPARKLDVPALLAAPLEPIAYRVAGLAADAYRDRQEPTRTDTVAERIVAALDGRRLKRSAIALAVDRAPSDGTVGRALQSLTAAGVIAHDATTKTYSLPGGKNGGKAAKSQTLPLATTLKGGNGKATASHGLAAKYQADVVSANGNGAQ